MTFTRYRRRSGEARQRGAELLGGAFVIEPGQPTQGGSEPDGCPSVNRGGRRRHPFQTWSDVDQWNSAFHLHVAPVA